MQIRSGNIRELWAVSYPMMISFFSLMLMIFVDRLFLSHYSVEAFDAATQAGTLSWAFGLGWQTMAAMSEVFVAQYNGAKQYDKIATPTWQMFWFTLCSTLFFTSVAVWGAPLIYDPLKRPHEYDFFRCLMYCGPLFMMIPALGGFFIGRGSTKIMQWLALLGNAVNIALDPILIFGVEGWIPPLGVVGAALATGTGTLVQVVVLFYCFLRHKERKKYGIDRWKPSWSSMKAILLVGLPPGVFVTLDLLGWAFFYEMMSMTGPIHIYVTSICQSIVILFFFFGMGLEKGAIALAGNFLGAGQPEKIKQVLLSGVKLILIFTLVAAICLIGFPDLLISWFTSNATELNGVVSSNTLFSLLHSGLILMVFYILFETLRWLINGILTAAGDTLFLMLSGVASVWLFLLLPTYFLILQPKNSVLWGLAIWVVYALLSGSLIAMRFASGKWRTKQLISLETRSSG